MAAISRADRRAARAPRVRAVFADRTDAALDLFELVELAWHDCYAEITPSEEIIDDVLFLSEGDLAKLVTYARLAVTDWRDVKMNVTALRERRGK
jgi:hypothetical protein